MKALYLLLVPSVLLGQEVRTPQRGEERREPNRSVELEMSRRNRRPTRLEMAPLRQPLTDKQKKQLLALRREFIQKRNRILNNP